MQVFVSIDDERAEPAIVLGQHVVGQRGDKGCVASGIG